MYKLNQQSTINSDITNIKSNTIKNHQFNDIIQEQQQQQQEQTQLFLTLMI